MKRAQSLIEFVLIFPILIVIILGILEYSVFWKNAHTVQEIAEAACAKAATETVTDDMTSANLGDADFNVAVKSAIETVEAKVSGLGEKNLTYAVSVVNTGDVSYSPPNALYKVDSNETRNVPSVGSLPIITFYVDYRKPYENGIITQLVYQYHTIFSGAGFVLPGGQAVTVIPADFELSSTKVYSFNQY